MATFRFFLSLLIFIALLSSCNSNQSLTTSGKYEDDEVYYQPGEKFYTDAFTPSSSASSSNSENNAQNSEEEDYYSGQPAEEGTVNNYYGDVYNGGWGGNGFARPGGRMMWDPMWGWRMSYGFGGFNNGWGMSSGLGWGNTWGNGWGGGWNNWNSPFYDPFYDPFYNPWNTWGWNSPYAFNSWGNPYMNPWGWNNFNNGWGWNNFNNPWAWNEIGNGLVFAPRPSLSSNSSFNSSVTTSPRRPRSSFLNSPNGSSGEIGAPSTPRPTGAQEVNTRPSINRDPAQEEFNPSRPSRPSQGNTTPNTRPAERPREQPSRVEPSRPSREPSRIDPPSRSRESAPSRPSIERSSPPPSRPSQGGGGSRGGGNNSGGSPRRR